MVSEIVTHNETSQIIAELEAERAHWRSGQGAYVDRVTEASLGSFWARRWTEYNEILHHNGAPDVILEMLSAGKTDPRIVDAGCAAGVALADLRRYLPGAELHGVDVRNANLWTISDRDAGWRTTGRKWFSDYHIDFHQDSYHAIPDLIPPYDLLFCVGAMPDRHSSHERQQYVLQQFYKGLAKGGYVQVLVQTSEEQLPVLVQSMTSADIMVQFHQGDSTVLKDNFFDSSQGLWGTFTLGPKQ